MKNSSTKSRDRFAQPHAPRSTWETAYIDAHTERTLMQAEFESWIVKKRFETERRLLTAEAHHRQIAPFARAGLDSAPTPQDVPMCVLEFASATLQVMDSKRQLALLNVFYRQAANHEGDGSFTVEEKDEAEFAELWAWFIDDRKDEEK